MMMMKPFNWQYLLLSDSPPPEWMQSLNDVLHTEPCSTIAHGLFWTAILFFGAPFAGGAVLIGTFVQLALWATGYSTKRISSIDDTNSNRAVVITGCDSGFGHLLALDCAQKGYYVFAACLKKESLSAFSEFKNVKPLVVDVSDDEHVAQMAKVVLAWVKENKERFLHAVVNNAGIGQCGLVDWLDMEVYQRCMEVNCFGQIRVVKAFLPFLKEQALVYSEQARIVNMVSVAGLVTSSTTTPYNTSKFAAEAFSNCLRLELRDFGIKVITMNPSFHATPMTVDMEGLLLRQFQKLPQDVQTKYGMDYVEKSMLPFIRLSRGAMWRPENVVHDLGRAIDLAHPPLRFITGMDGRFSFLVLRMLPDMIQSWFIPRLLHPPAFFGTAKEKTS